MLEIVAEMSANHLGDFNRACALVDAAAAAGADLFKAQVWEPGTMCIDRGYTLQSGPWAGRKLFDLYEEAWTPWEWLPDLFKRARQLGMEPFGAAFDRKSVDYLDSLGVKRHKVASFELVDLPLIEYMATKDKPIVLSTGMASRDEVYEAILSAEETDYTLLACTSAYPADPADSGLERWRSRSLPWGISDHTPGVGVACAAVALGAVMVEKHLTLSRADGGPDAGFSLEPAEFETLVRECRAAHAAVQPVAGPPKGEDRSLRRSMWVTRDVRAGERLLLGVNVATARPALGMAPRMFRGGCIAARDLSACSPLTEADCRGR